MVMDVYRERILSFTWMFMHEWLWLRIEQACSYLIDDLLFEYPYNAQFYGIDGYGCV